MLRRMKRVSLVLAWLSALFAARCLFGAAKAMIKGDEGTFEIVWLAVWFVLFSVYPLIFLIKRESEQKALKNGTTRF